MFQSRANLSHYNMEKESLFYNQPNHRSKLKTVEALFFEECELIDDEDEAPPLESDWHVAVMALLRASSKSKIGSRQGKTGK